MPCVFGLPGSSMPNLDLSALTGEKSSSRSRSSSSRRPSGGGLDLSALTGGGGGGARGDGGSKSALSKIFGWQPIKRTLDVLDRPGQMVKGAIKEGPGGAWRGLSGAERYQVLAPESGGGFLGAAARFAEDVVLDPTTYLTFGVGGVAKSGVRQVAKSAGREAAEQVSKGAVRGVALRQALEEAGVGAASRNAPRALERTARSIERTGQGGMRFAGQTLFTSDAPISRAALAGGRAVRESAPGQWTRRAFVPGSRLQDSIGREAADQVWAASAAARVAPETQTAVKELAKLVKDTKATRADLQGPVRFAMEAGGAVEPRLEPLVTRLKELRSTSEEMSGLAPELLHDPDTYMRRLLTPEAKRFLREAEDRLPGTRPFSNIAATEAQGGALKARTLTGETVDEAENQLRGYLQQAGVKAGDKPLFERNAAKAVAVRYGEAERAVAQSKMFEELRNVTDEAGESIVRSVEDAPKTYQPVVAGGREYRVHPAVKAELDRVVNASNNDEATRAFARMWDEANNLWKGAVYLPIFRGPAPHTRNAVSNIWSLILGGVRNPGRLQEAAQIQLGLRKGTLKGRPAEIAQWAREDGIVRGLSEAELRRADRLDELAGKGGKTARDLPRQASDLLTGPGRAVAGVTEDNARLALYIDVLEKGGSRRDAMLAVRKYLFDYTPEGLTDFERKVVSRIVPFVRWQARNLPLQVAEAARQPGKFTALAHGLRTANEEYDIDLPPMAAVETLTKPFQPKGAQSMAGGAAGAVLNQVTGEKVIPERGTERYKGLPLGAGSESRLDTLISDVIPYYGKYGTVSTALRRLSGDDKDPMRLVTGLRRRDEPVTPEERNAARRKRRQQETGASAPRKKGGLDLSALTGGK